MSNDDHSDDLAAEGAWAPEVPMDLVIRVLTPLATSIVQAAIVEADPRDFGATRIEELAIGVIAANSELLATAAAEAAAKAQVPGEETEKLRRQLMRDLRSGDSGNSLVRIVLDHLSAGLHVAESSGPVPGADVRALMELNMQCRAIVGMELGRLLESGVRDRFDLISAASDALTAATPRLVDSLRATLLADGFPVAEANGRAENLRGNLNSIAIAGLATQIALEFLADWGSLDR